MKALKIIDNFLDQATCNYMVEVYKDMFIDVEKTRDNRKLIKNPQNSEITAFLKGQMPKINKALDNTYYIRELLLSIYEPGAYLKAHTDYDDFQYRDSLGVLFYFNDDFEGGEIYFTNFDFNYKPKQGSIFIFPCNKIHYEHGVNLITKGIRYTMPIEITLNKTIAHYNI